LRRIGLDIVCAVRSRHERRRCGRHVVSGLPRRDYAAADAHVGLPRLPRQYVLDRCGDACAPSRPGTSLSRAVGGTPARPVHDACVPSDPYAHDEPVASTAARSATRFTARISACARRHFRRNCRVGGPRPHDDRSSSVATRHQQPSTTEQHIDEQTRDDEQLVVDHLDVHDRRAIDESTTLPWAVARQRVPDHGRR